MLTDPKNGAKKTKLKSIRITNKVLKQIENGINQKVLSFVINKP